MTTDRAVPVGRFSWDRLPPPDVVESVCPLCGSEQVRPVYDSGLGWNGHVGTVHCGRCTGLFTSPHHDTATLSRFYAEEFPKHAPLRHIAADGEVRSGDGLTRSRFVVNAVGPPAGWRILEIGAGSGEFLVAMARAGAGDGLGLEPALAVPESRRPGVTLRRRAVTDPDAIGEGKFNLVAMFHVLEHIVDPVPFLKKVRAQLTSPGFLAIEVPNLYRFRFPNPDTYFRVIHLTNFTPRSLRLAAADCGLYPMRWNRVGAKPLMAVFRTEPGEPGGRDDEGPSYARCRAFLRFIAGFSRLEPRLQARSRRLAQGARWAAQIYAQLVVRSARP